MEKRKLTDRNFILVPFQVIYDFLKDAFAYASEMKKFTFLDWIVYFLWVGLMLGLLVCTAGFVLLYWFFTR